MNIQKMIDSLRVQITAMEESVAALEKLQGLSTGGKKRGRPPLARCDKGCGRPKHRGRCRRGSSLASYKRNFPRAIEKA